MSAVAVVLMGEKAFEFMGVPTPVWYTTNIAPNKMVGGAWGDVLCGGGSVSDNVG